MTKSCLLLPLGEVRFEVIRQWSEAALSSDQPRPAWAALARGLVEYRQNRFETSVDWLRKAVLEGNEYVGVIGESVLAMAQYRLNLVEQAQTTLAKAVEAQRKLPRLDSRDLGWDWDDVLAANLLLHEAQALILGKPGRPSGA